MSNETRALDVSSPIGRALLLQVISVLLIMGTIVLPVLTLQIGAIWFVILSGLWVIAFIQMLIVRAILQKENWGVSTALIVSVIAMLLAVIAGVSWVIPLVDILNGIYFFVIGSINAILSGILALIRKSS